MNSKEALNNIEKLFIGSPINPTQQIEIIKKALEVLDILKKNLYHDNKNHAIKMKEIRKSTRNFDYEDLKEWIESEK